MSSRSSGHVRPLVLWTIQTEGAWERALARGRIVGDGRFVDRHRRAPYAWLIDQMRRRIDPTPRGATYPVWAWYRCDEKSRRPDLRGRAHLPRGPRGVRVAF